MQPAQLLARDHLAPHCRILIAVGVAIWRGDWPSLTAWFAAAEPQGLPREDLEETLLQCVLFCGFPRVITAFEHLQKSWPEERAPSGGYLPSAEQLTAGNELFRTIYGKNDAAVRAMLKSYHEELHDFVLEAAYGRILTRPQLPPRTRELIAVAVLATQSQKRQFAGHARGAMHLGASREELREALITAFGTTDEGMQVVDSWLALMR
jgi:4-carboxymuconolactone decarboxylase